MVGLWCSLWLPRVAMKQQVACTWGSNVPFCMSCLSYHLAWLYWLLLLGLPLLFRVSCWHSLTLPGIPAHWKLWFLPPDPSPPAVHKLGSQECRPSARNFFFQGPVSFPLMPMFRSPCQIVIVTYACWHILSCLPGPSWFLKWWALVPAPFPRHESYNVSC